MLKIRNDMDFRQLAHDMIEDITKCWTDPFNPPTVIFPDPMVEKWFKLYWLESYRALLNLKFESIDQFLFNALQNDAKAKLLSSEMLRLAIIKKLSEKEYYKTLGEDIAKYLSDNGSINWNRLYDYSKTMAELLLDYERTRPNWDSTKKDNEVSIDSPWYASEVKLYNDLFTDGLLALNGSNYSTFSQLSKHSKGKFLDLSNHQPVFVFGFPGLGKTYIDALKKIAASCVVRIYIQADTEEGFCNFGQHGTVFLNAWEMESEPGEKTRDINGNLIPKFISAPSKLREIDKLHNEICRMLQKADAPMLSEIKVFAPNIKDYIPAISLVFSQSVKQSDGNSRHIPYSISDFSAKTSNTYEAANILFRMFEKGYFSRADFIRLINNPVVQTTRSITEEDVSTWKDWIREINIYRNRKDRNDWEVAKKRLVLAKLTEETIDGLSPYETIGGDDSTLFRFIDMIDGLENWIGLRQNKTSDFTLTVENVKEFLRSMLSLGKTNDKSLKGERDVYLKVMGALSNLQTVFGEQGINYKTIFLMIMDSISGVSLSISSEAKGIEFITFKPGRVIPANYTFFIGMDSKAFPGTDNKNVLDVRKQRVDESVVVRNKNALYCQMQATENEIRFSYVNKDLKKDEDFYRSSVLNVITKKLGRVKDNSEGLIEDKIGIDETWDVAFTNRNRRDNAISSISDDGITEDSVIPTINTSEPPKRVTISQLRSFLEEPLKFQIQTAFGYGDDDIEEEETEFEPIELDNLTASNLRKRYIKEGINTKDKLEEDLKAKGILFDGLYGQMEIENLQKETENLNKGIKELLLVESLADRLNIIVATSDGKAKHITDGHEWAISNGLSYFNIDYDRTKRIVTIVKQVDKSDFSNAYASAITLLSKASNDEEYDLELYVLNVEDETVSKLCASGVNRDFANSELDAFYNYKLPKRATSVDPRYKQLNVKRILDDLSQYPMLKVLESDKDTIRYELEDSSEYIIKSKEFVDLVKKTIQEEQNTTRYSDKNCSIRGIEKKFEAICSDLHIESIEYGTETIQNTKSLEYDLDLSGVENNRKNDGEYPYEIIGKVQFYDLDESSKHILIVDLKNKAEIKDFLNAYVSSLAILSTLKDDSEYTLSLCLVCSIDGTLTIKPICLTAEKAKQLLNDIYTDAFIHRRQRFLPISLLEGSEPTYEEMVAEAEGQNGSWQYFKKSRIIEIPDGLGYDQSEFEKQWKEEAASQLKLIDSLLDKEE